MGDLFKSQLQFRTMKRARFVVTATPAGLLSQPLAPLEVTERAWTFKQDTFLSLLAMVFCYEKKSALI